MASRKKKPDPELIPNSVEIDAKQIIQPTRKVVETKTITYEQPEDELPDEPEPEFDYEDTPKRRKTKTSRDERESLKNELIKSNILPASNLRVHVFKYAHDNGEMSGMAADKSFCEKFFTTKDQLLSGYHLERAKLYGPGKYWFVTYLDNKIVTSWEESVAAMGAGQQFQNGQQMVSMPDPQNPNVIVQMPAGQPPPPQKTFKQELKEMVETFELMQKLNGNNQQQQQNPAQLSPELQMAGFMLQDADLKKKAIKSLFGAGGGEPEKDILTTVIENVEPIGKAIQGIIQQIFVNVQEVRGNGTAAMVSPALENHGQVSGQRPEHGQAGQIQGIQETSGQAPEGDSQNLQERAIAIRPEDELLAGILDHCKRRMPPRMAADRAFKYAEYVERVAPQQSVFTLIEQFTDNPIEESLALFELLSDEAKEILAMPHAKAWATQLQAELKKAYEPGGEQ